MHGPLGWGACVKFGEGEDVLPSGPKRKGPSRGAARHPASVRQDRDTRGRAQTQLTSLGESRSLPSTLLLLRVVDLGPWADVKDGQRPLGKGLHAHGNVVEPYVDVQRHARGLIHRACPHELADAAVQQATIESHVLAAFWVRQPSLHFRARECNEKERVSVTIPWFGQTARLADRKPRI